MRCSWCASCARSLARTHGTAQPAADQIGCGVKSLHTWVKQADVEVAKSDAIDAEAVAVAILRYRRELVRQRTRDHHQRGWYPDLQVGPNHARLDTGSLPCRAWRVARGHFGVENEVRTDRC